MMKTKFFCLALCLALLLAALPFTLGEADDPHQTRRLRLGSSIYTIDIDSSFTYGRVTEADAAEGQVAYLCSEKLAVDFDVYQISVEGEPLPLEEYVARAVSAHSNADEIVTNGEINDIPVGWFHTVETYDGVDYQTVTYVLDNGDGYVEVTFWLDGEDAEAVAQGMINTLAYDNLAPVRLGSSPFYVFCSTSYHEGGMTSEDVADDQVAYWVSDETLLDFDVYQFSKEGLPKDLADYVAQEAEKYSATAVETQAVVNDIPVGWYRTVETYDGVDYETLTCAMDAGEEYVEIVFWLDGLTAGAEADAILQSLWMESEETEAGEAEAEEARAEAIDEGGADVAEPEGAQAGVVATEGMDASTKVLRLGTSPFTIVVPVSFVEGEMTQEDIEDDQVGYYYSNETMLDFDVYQFSKDGYPNDLAIYTDEEISGYNSVSELVTDGEINGVPAAWYRTVETYQDAEFNTLTYILDGGDEYVEVCFWLDGENADAEAKAIINTLAVEAATESLGGEGAMEAEAEEEVSEAQRPSLDAFEAAVGEGAAEFEADQPGDGADAIEADGVAE